MLVNGIKLCDRLKTDILEKVGGTYYKVWVQYTLMNKKKQQYGFTITLFPRTNEIYTMKFVHRVPVNMVKDEERGVYEVKNYDQILNKIVEVLE